MRKRDLATLYLPDIKPECAVNRLTEWINHCPPLRDALRREGYNPRSKRLRVVDVRLITEHLGVP
jgi:hypothetical protein